MQEDTDNTFEARVQQAYDETARALLAAASEQDNHIKGHSERVAAIAEALGRRLGLSAVEMSDLRYAAHLHDIGKIGVSRNIVNKLGKLTDEEIQAMRLHSLIGIRILENVAGLQGALPMIRHHHERWDGTGYPDGLAGEAIPVGARIIGLAEAFDILTSSAPWREAMTTKEACDEIKRCSKTQFDPHLVELLLEEAGELA